MIKYEDLTPEEKEDFKFCRETGLPWGVKYSIVTHSGEPFLYRSFGLIGPLTIGCQYVRGFGWDSSSIEPDIYEYSYNLVDQFYDEEKAKQWIRDNYGKEPVNFDGPASNWEEWAATQPLSLQEIEDSMGLEDEDDKE